MKPVCLLPRSQDPATCPCLDHVILGWSLVTTAWRVLSLRMEETSFMYGG
jgi:hypothetical protein